MKSSYLAVAALTVSFAGSALAADNSTMRPTAPSSPNPQFTTLDTNKDGRLSQAEVRAHGELSGRFSTLDSDADTYLSQMEYGKWEGSGRVQGNEPARVPGAGNPADSSSNNSSDPDKPSRVPKP